MLKENKELKTPEDKKKKAAARAKRIALSIYPNMLGVVFSNKSVTDNINTLIDAGKTEDAEQLRNEYRASAARASINAVKPFDKEWKKLRGIWLEDAAKVSEEEED